MKLPINLDLHGLSVQQGFHKTLMFMKIHKMQGSRACRIITGRSGKMNREFKHWMNHPSFKAVTDQFYHDFHKGSWTVKF